MNYVSMITFIIIIIAEISYYNVLLRNIFNTASVYSPFSNRFGLPLPNIHSSGVLMKSIGLDFF